MPEWEREMHAKHQRAMNRLAMWLFISGLVTLAFEIGKAVR